MTAKIPMFLDSKLRWVKFFEPDGIALQEDFDFPVIGKTRLYPYPHPEQITMPRHVKCRRVTNKGSVLPAEYYDLIKDMVRLGLADTEPVSVHGRAVAPADFALAYIVRERDRILKRIRFGSQRGCASVVVKGVKDGKGVEYRFHMASASQALGEGTGIPAAVGAVLMLQGKVKGPGVLPPEACVNPLDFIALVPEVMKLDKKKEGGKGFGGVIVERVDEDGKVTKLDIG
jgi:saccharopine dehydrogenase (NAD+, L-lysine forming)